MKKYQFPYTPEDMVTAMKNAGHNYNVACIEMNTSSRTLAGFRKHRKLPSSIHLQKAIAAYIKKHL